MNTFSVGDKVTVNDSYFDLASEDPDELREAIQTEGTVVSTQGLISVRFDSGIEWDEGRDVWLFATAELEAV